MSLKGANVVRTLYTNANIYDSQKQCFAHGALLVVDGAIGAVFWGDDEAYCGYDTEVDLGGRYLSPGLVDIHTHGRAGGDFVSADGKMLGEMSRSYLESGVTSVMPTLASAPLCELERAADRIADRKERGDTVFEGIHLEGRYLNPKKRGAHAEALLAALDPDELERLVFRMCRAGKVYVSAALELDESREFASRAKKLGVTLGLAHTDADFESAEKTFESFATSLTHTFNAMPPLHHRAGGAVAAAFDNPDVFCELIADGLHVSPEMVRLSYKIKGEKLVLVTDSMEATGEPDGEYSIAGMPVTVKDGRAVTHDGALAGSTLSLLDGVKNLSRFAKIPFEKALYCATAAPAQVVGIYGCVGSLDVGKRANMIVLDEDLELCSVILGGNNI